MLKNGNHEKEIPHKTFNFFAIRKIEQYQVLTENEENIPYHKKIHYFLKRITTPEIGMGKYAISAALGPTLPTLDVLITFLIYFVSQKNSGYSTALMNRGADMHRRGHRRGGHFWRGGGGGPENGRGRGSRGHGGCRAKTTVTDRTYTSSEWCAISNDQKDNFNKLNYQQKKKRNALVILSKSALSGLDENNIYAVKTGGAMSQKRTQIIDQRFWYEWRSGPRIRYHTVGSSCSFKQYVGVSNAPLNNLNTEGCTDLDPHSNTCVAGRAWPIWEYTSK